MCVYAYIVNENLKICIYTHIYSDVTVTVCEYMKLTFASRLSNMVVKIFIRQMTSSKMSSFFTKKYTVWWYCHSCLKLLDNLKYECIVKKWYLVLSR